MTDSQLWAKSTGETWLQHTRECLALGEKMMNNLPGAVQEIWPDLEKDLKLGLLFHDTGKIAEGFQKYLRKEAPHWNGWRHELLSAAFAARFSLLVKEEVIIAIATHHKRLPLFINAEKVTLPREQLVAKNESPKPVWIDMVEDWLRNAGEFIAEWNCLAASLGLEDLLQPESPKNLTDSGLSYYWLAQDDRRFNKKLIIEQKLYASLLRGLLMTIDHLASMGRHDLPAVPCFKDYPVMVNPRPFQKNAQSKQGHVFLVAPTGAGKTQAALLWAASNQAINSRLFYVLPHTASVNAMYNRLVDTFDPERVGLLHSKAISFLYKMLEADDGTKEKKNLQQGARSLASLARELWYPVRVSTLHQILRPLLGGRGWELSMAEYQDALFVFDEVHAYNPTLMGLLIAAMKILESWGGRFIFISATFPRFLRKEIKAALQYPMLRVRPKPGIPEDRRLLTRERHRLFVCDGTLRDQYPEIEAALAAGKTVLVVCNHVDTSVTVYKELKARNAGIDAMLLHSRFNAEDRALKEERLIRGRLPVLLVATQVVEVSLDIDFDRGFFEPAPIDALVQRFGRVNRKEKPLDRPAGITVVTRELSIHRIYDENLVERTLERLRGIEGIVKEHKLVKVIDWVYMNGYTGKAMDDFERAKEHSLLNNWEKSMKAGWYEPWVEKLLESSLAKVDVLPEPLLQEYTDRLNQGLWLKAQDLLLPVTYSKKWLKDIDTAQEPWIINAGYSSETGLTFV